jgi:ribonuclease BN (tRNA processing enzyme)
MEIMVLGRYAPWPPAGGACSGYLVRSGSTTVLIDGGPGVAARLLGVTDIAALDAVVVSHLHEDHISDLHCLQFAVMSAQWDGRRQGPLPVYCPPEPVEKRRWLTDVVGGLFSVQDLPVATGLTVGDLRFTFAPTVHPIPCYAMRVENGRCSLFYSADTNHDANATLLPLARGADLALVEASLPAAGADRRWLGHMTAADAAAFGQAAGVRRLLLTHLWPDLAPAGILAEARAVWPQAELAEELRTYQI